MTTSANPLLENCCKPCNSCPDDGPILETTILDPDDCNTNCCWNSCSDNRWINIQSTNDCLIVDTSECGVIKLTAECPRPTYVKAWNNVTVRDVTPPDDCYIDWGDCWVKWWWEINATDEKVKACSGDTTPGYLIDKLQAGSGINIDPIGCDWSNSKIKISIDEDILPECPDIPEITIIDHSDLINATVGGADWHTITITDQNAKMYYAKLVLSEWHDWIKTDMAQDTTKSYTLFGSGSTANWTTVYNKNLTVQSWYIKITKTWLYHVGFSGSAECWSWVHAFRVQLYSSAEESSNNKTIIESRYSAPIWDQPFEVSGSRANLRYVSWVSGGWEEGEASASYSNFKVDNPLWWPATDIEWTQREANGKSASLWSYVSRMPVWWSTIVELKKWDIIWIWVKISSEVTYDWDILWSMDDLSPHFALLCKNSHRSWWVNTWPECWLSFYADLIHPLNTISE